MDAESSVNEKASRIVRRGVVAREGSFGVTGERNTAPATLALPEYTLAFHYGLAIHSLRLELKFRLSTFLKIIYII